MDQQTNDEKPSSKEGEQVKVGDKVWVLCEVVGMYKHWASTYIDLEYDGTIFQAKQSDCRLDEPSNSSEIPNSSSEPLAPSPCMDGVDVDQFIEGIMEARGRTDDPINPSHYKQGPIECIEAIKAATGDGFVGYVWGNVLKYLWRWPKKGGIDDLKKARWYLDRLIKEVGE
jgi:hypothetical protein